MEEELQNVAQQFEKLQKQGAVHEAEIAKHQNALRIIMEELVRLQGEKRALDRIINKANAPCQPTPSSQEIDSQK